MVRIQEVRIQEMRVQGENNYFTDMCSGSEAGSYLRLIDFVYHSTLGLRVIKKKKKVRVQGVVLETLIFDYFQVDVRGPADGKECRYKTTGKGGI